MNRREMLAILAALPRAVTGAGVRRTPLLCVHSGSMTGVGYPEIGEIAGQLGFEGVDLTVFSGGQVDPSQAPVDLVRAVETITSAGLELPVITTHLNAALDPWARTVVGLAGGSGIATFKTGIWAASVSPRSPLAQLSLQRRDVAGLALIGRQYNCNLALTIRAAESESLIDDWPALLAGLDPQLAGLSLDSALFPETGGAARGQFERIFLRTKTMTIRDFGWSNRSNVRVREWKPAGQGEVDFSGLFDALARTGFTGPLTIERNYSAKDEPTALSKDAAFVRRCIETSYAQNKT